MDEEHQPGEPEDDNPSRVGPIIAMAIIAVLVLGTIYIGQRLREAGRIQDCVTAGRTNCAPIEAPSR